MKTKLTILAVLLAALVALAAPFDIFSTFNSTPLQNIPCSVTHNAVANYIKPPIAWGWKLDMSTSVHAISVPTNAVVEWSSKTFHSGCGIGSAVVTGTSTDKFRFSVYWPDANGPAPTNDYPLTLVGFLP